MTTVLEAKDVWFHHGNRPILQGISFRVRKAETVALLGPNGSGKSTLLKTLLGIYPCRAGEIHLDGRPLSELSPRHIAKRVAYVPQLHDLAFPYSVFDVVLMGRIVYRSLWSSYAQADRASALSALERLGIAHLRDRPYTEISGGERQLALIARAVAQGAEILVMDEPVSGLDFGNQVRLLEQIGELASQGFTCLKSTHFPDHALLVADRVILLKDGRIVDDGQPDQVINKENIRRLYQVPVDIISVHENYRCCVPRVTARNTGV